MTEKTRSNKKTGKRKLIVALIVSAAVLIAAAAVTLYMLRHNESNKKITYKTDAEGNVASVNTDSGLVYNDHLSNFLFLGIDGRGTVDSIESMWDIGSADAIFLVSYDRAKETIRELVIPRDTMAVIETFNPMGRSLGLSVDHLNIQYGYGDGKLRSCEITKTAISELLGGQIPIQGYCSLRMDGIPLLADLLGGVEVTVPDDTMADEEEGYHKGDVITLTTETAEHFLRYRDTEQSQSAIDRQARQRAFMEGFVKKAKVEAEKDSSLVTKFYEALKPYMVTNMGNDQFAKLLAAENLGSDTLPGEGVEGTMYDEYYVNVEEMNKLLSQIFFN